MVRTDTKVTGQEVDLVVSSHVSVPGFWGRSEKYSNKLGGSGCSYIVGERATVFWH